MPGAGRPCSADSPGPARVRARRCSAPLHSRAMYHVRRAADIALDTPAAYTAHGDGHGRAVVVGPAVGAVHTGITQCVLDPGGTVGEHLHSYEKSFYVLEGHPRLTVDGRTWQLSPDDCGLVPLGVAHAWRNADGEPCRWIEASAP